MKKIFLLVLGFCLMVNIAFAGSLVPVAKVKKAKPVQPTAVTVFTQKKINVAPATLVSIDLIRTLGVKAPGTPAYWQAEVKNIGLGNIPANTLKIKARQYQMQSPSQPATAPFAIIHAMKPGRHRGLQGNWTPITGCTHLEIIVMDNKNKVLAKKMHLVEFPRLTVPAKKLFVPKQPLQSQQQMYIKVAKIKHVNHMGSPVEGRDYKWQARCQKLVSGDLPSNRVSLFFDLSNSETGARVHIGTFSYGRTIQANNFTIQYTFKYREAYDTITLRMYDSVTKKTISEKSVNCAPFGTQ
jgi:hypothetical protein